MITSILPLAFTALGLCGTLILFVSVKRELRRQSRRIDNVLNQLREAAQAPVSALRPRLNIQKRFQALRLLRRGEDVAHVAAALCVPRREVELLIHVQELSAKRAAG
jgi:hypothetical protein